MIYLNNSKKYYAKTLNENECIDNPISDISLGIEQPRQQPCIKENNESAGKQKVSRESFSLLQPDIKRNESFERENTKFVCLIN